MMVSRDEEEQVCEAESEDFTSNGVEQPLPHKDVVFSNAEEEIPEYRKQLLLAKDEMANVADMYQQDYLDKVEQRLMLKFLIPCNRVNDLTSIFIPLSNHKSCIPTVIFRILCHFQPYFPCAIISLTLERAMVIVKLVCLLW